MAIFRRCRHCKQLYEGKGCPECEKKFTAYRDKKRRETHTNLEFYHSYLWQQCRKNVVTKYMGYDIWLLAEGQIYRDEHPTVHHIVERDEDPSKIYDLDNLITVSDESHKEIHKWYKINKQYALDRIARGIAKFEETFEV